MATDAELEDKTETIAIQKPDTSRPQKVQVEGKDSPTRYPDNTKLMQSKKSLVNAETKQDTETPTEIYPGIYLETRSTASLDNTDPTEGGPSLPICNEAETVKETETSEIQKPGTSRPSELQSEDINIPTSKSDREEEILPDAETSEIYQEIYPQTRSTALLEDTATGMQKQTFEESIIDMFGLPEKRSIKELIPASSPIPDLTLDLGPALPLEDILLDYLNDNNII